MVSGTNPSLNPRLAKVAGVLSQLDWQVDVFCPCIVPALKEEDEALANAGGWRIIRYFDWEGSKARLVFERATRKAADILNRRLQFESAYSLGYGMFSGLRPLLPRLSTYDLMIGHQEVGLWAGMRIRENLPVWIDIEDWYSRDLLPEALPGRPVGLLQNMERLALTKAKLCTTTTKAMAQALHHAYGGVEPAVLYNTFKGGGKPSWQDRAQGSVVSFHWFSQTIGRGRGLGVLLQAIKLLPDLQFEVHLRGRLGCEDWLRRQLDEKSDPKLILHPLVSNQELDQRIAEHDVGLALEPTIPDNKNLTASNKIFHYLVNGLDVIATRTKGQVEVAKLAGEGRMTLVDQNDAEALAAAMRAAICRGPRQLTRELPTELTFVGFVKRAEQLAAGLVE
ncbi:MAG: hypothetical protein DHS20C11_16570 [Lysobacteraceae bacterium]|nr:MAG: hypothetical protein DHS20C11_16570 [Xanthomonadaceae bacterium]